jgi:hypothetical protein
MSILSPCRLVDSPQAVIEDDNRNELHRLAKADE